LNLSLEVSEPILPGPEPNVGGGAHPGDITKAALSVILSPVGPGGTVVTTCTPAGPVSLDSNSYGTQKYNCSASVGVNTYSVAITINGNYYTGSYDDDVLVVYDPSLGFTTGGGHILWPSGLCAGNKANFGYTMKYNKNGTNAQGSLLVICHMPDGTTYRIKSNALGGLSLGDNPSVPMGWASFTGKATYVQPGWSDPAGNYSFIVYVEDRNEPGTGPDKFWFEVKDPSGAIVPAFSMSPDAASNAQATAGGNIVVPHTPNPK